MRATAIEKGGSMRAADTVFLHGHVITVNEKDEIAEAVAVSGNQICMVGTSEEVQAAIGTETKVIDLRGRTLMPGFIDAHMHLTLLALLAGEYLDVNSDQLPTIDALKEAIAERARQVPKETWIKCWGYEQSKLLDQRHPTAADLNEAAPDHPVQVVRCCGHMGVYNSKALALIDLEKFQPDEVMREQGRATGLLKESAHNALWSQVAFTREGLAEGLRKTSRELLSMGITSVHDAGGYGAKTLDMMEQASRTGDLGVRVYQLLYSTFGKEATNDWQAHIRGSGIRTGFGNRWFRIGAMKQLLDGSTSGPSSATRAPYSHDPELKGILNLSQREMDDFVRINHEAGYQVTAHAVGDLSVEMFLAALEKALGPNPAGSFHRIEHCALTDERLIEQLRRLKITPISNPGFFYENASAYIRYYGDRVRHMFPLKSYLEKGIPTALGSDAPVISANPMIGLYGAVCRRDKCSGETAGREQRVGLLDAIRMYTYNGALASMEADRKGSIEAGKLADLTVLSCNLLQCPEDALKEVQVDFTMVDGKLEYSRVDV